MSENVNGYILNEVGEPADWSTVEHALLTAIVGKLPNAGSTVTATNRHSHSILVSADGSVDPAVTVANNGTVTINQNLTVARGIYDLIELTGTGSGGLTVRATGAIGGLTLDTTNNYVSLSNNSNTIAIVQSNAFNVNGGAFVLSSVVDAGAGGTSGTPEDVVITGKNILKLDTSNLNQYYNLTGTPIEGQILYIHNDDSVYPAYVTTIDGTTLQVNPDSTKQIIYINSAWESL